MEPRKRAGTLLLLVLPALLAAACSRREGRDAEAGARPRSCRLKAVIDPRPVSLLPYEGIALAMLVCVLFMIYERMVLSLPQN